MKKKTISVNSPAKVNLGLLILNKREDGYHNLDTIFCELGFGDEILFTESDKFEFSFEGIEVPIDESNLVVKAYQILALKKEKRLPHFKVHLKKKIPIGTGLGGGSSNAGVTIKALNTLWKLNLSSNDMKSISANLGADVAFFIDGRVQHATGIGEELNEINSTFLEGKKLLLVCPNFSISTAWAYKNINKYLNVRKDSLKFAPLETPVNWQLFENDFEKVVKSTYPETGEIIKSLKQTDAIYTGLSGSGSTVFGIYDQFIDLKNIQKSFPDTYRTFETSFNL